jgi:hypothetical protein
MNALPVTRALSRFFQRFFSREPLRATRSDDQLRRSANDGFGVGKMQKNRFFIQRLPA